MLDALVGLLEEKGIITHKEWEKRIENRIRKSRGLRKYRDIQFEDEEGRT